MRDNATPPVPLRFPARDAGAVSPAARSAAPPRRHDHDRAIADVLATAGCRLSARASPGRRGSLALHAVADAVSALACLAIPAAIWRFLAPPARPRAAPAGSGRSSSPSSLTAALPTSPALATLWCAAPRRCRARSRPLTAAVAARGRGRDLAAAPEAARAALAARPRPRQPRARPDQRLARDHRRLAHPRARAAPASASSRRCRARTLPSSPRTPTSATPGSTTPASA